MRIKNGYYEQAIELLEKHNITGDLHRDWIAIDKESNIIISFHQDGKHYLLKLIQKPNDTGYRDSSKFNYRIYEANDIQDIIGEGETDDFYGIELYEPNIIDF